MQLIFIIIFIALCIWWMISVRSKVPEGQINSESLSKGKEKVITCIMCVVNPIWGGAILYYGWKKKLPTKAKQANKMSMIVFLIELAIGIIFVLNGFTLII